jgi:hypothetical protein
MSGFYKVFNEPAGLAFWRFGGIDAMKALPGKIVAV